MSDKLLHREDSRGIATLTLNSPNSLNALSFKSFHKNISNRLKSYSYELSGGEKQRVTLARAIVKEPTLILADEPTGNLDPVAAFELVQLLETINNNGTTILMASHNYNLIKGRGQIDELAASSMQSEIKLIHKESYMEFQMIKFPLETQ